MKAKFFTLIIAACTVPALVLLALAEEPDESQVKRADKDLAADLELLQGKWELRHGGGNGPPTVRSVKTIEGNKETLRGYRLKDGKKLREHTVEFQLSKSGSVRVFTFYPVEGSPERGLSYVYKVDEKNFWDMSGVLQGDEYRNYQANPHLWHWKRVEADVSGDETEGESEPGGTDAESKTPS